MMLTIRYIDRLTGEPSGTYSVMPSVRIQFLDDWANEEGWDIEILGYLPG